MSSTKPHEPQLSPEQLDVHRATISLVEELEAFDWYDQRAQACSDAALRTILVHNRDEEAEHAAMLLQWLSARRPSLREALQRFVWKQDASERAVLASDASGSPIGRPR